MKTSNTLFDTQCTDEWGNTVYIEDTRCPLCGKEMKTRLEANGKDDYDKVSYCECGYTLYP